MPNSKIPANIVQRKTVIVGKPVTAPETPPEVIPPVVVLGPNEVTRFQFRKLFTTAERMVIDNAQYNSTFSGSTKAAINTMQKDMEVSGLVNLTLPDTITGVNFLVTLGIITQARATRILAGLPPL